MQTNEKWFGVVRKSDGKIIMKGVSVAECPAHSEFLTKFCSFERGDTLLELFSNSLLEVNDFYSYAKEFYLNERPMVQPMRVQKA